jgi:hypothetical protein
MVYASDQRLSILYCFLSCYPLSSFVILVILSFGVRRGKDSNLLAENCFISQVPPFVIYIDSQHNFNRGINCLLELQSSEELPNLATPGLPLCTAKLWLTFSTRLNPFPFTIDVENSHLDAILTAPRIKLYGSTANSTAIYPQSLEDDQVLECRRLTIFAVFPNKTVPT